jgi:hypothetical protein
MPASPVVRYRSEHKLSAEEATELRMALRVA